MSDGTVEIIEEEGQTEEKFDTEGLTDGELELAKSHGLVKEEKKFEEKPKESVVVEDGEHQEQSEPKTEEDSEKKEEVRPATFEDVENDENRLKEYSPNEKALYWKWKADKKKRQQAQRDFDELKAQYELQGVKDSVAERKLNLVREALQGEDLTVEKLNAILGDTVHKDEVLTKSEFNRLQLEQETKKQEAQKLNQRQAERLQVAENIGKSKYENFDEIVTLANEVVASDKTGTYRGVLDASFSDKEVDEEDLVERVVTIARLNPKFGKKKDSVSAENAQPETNVDRAIKNSKKKISSAAVARSGKRVVAHDELTADDAAKMTTKQWMELPDRVRERILKGG